MRLAKLKLLIICVANIILASNMMACGDLSTFNDNLESPNADFGEKFRVRQNIGPEGGEIILTLDPPFGSLVEARLVIPAGALTTTTEISMAPVDQVPLVQGSVLPFGVVDLQPHGLQFQQPATFSIQYDSNVMDDFGWLGPEFLTMITYDDLNYKWSQLNNQIVEDGHISSSINGFSYKAYTSPLIIGSSASYYTPSVLAKRPIILLHGIQLPDDDSDRIFHQNQRGSLLKLAFLEAMDSISENELENLVTMYCSERVREQDCIEDLLHDSSWPLDEFYKTSNDFIEYACNQSTVEGQNYCNNTSWMNFSNVNEEPYKTAITSFGDLHKILIQQNLPVYSIRYYTETPIEVHACELKYALRKILEKHSTHNIDDVYVIAHSMGGLVTRAYTVNMGQHGNFSGFRIDSCIYGNDIYRLFTADTPHQGGSFTTSGWPGFTSYYQLDQNSEFIDGLNQRPLATLEGNNPEYWIAIAGDNDDGSYLNVPDRIVLEENAKLTNIFPNDQNNIREKRLTKCNGHNECDHNSESSGIVKSISLNNKNTHETYQFIQEFLQEPLLCIGPQEPPRSCGKCGTQKKICNTTTGLWDGWDTCTNEKTCTPGQTQTCAEGTKTCNESCDWGSCVPSTCIPQCGSRQCGPSPNGCGSCGSCPTGSSCDNGIGLCTNSPIDNPPIVTIISPAQDETVTQFNDRNNTLNINIEMRDREDIVSYQIHLGCGGESPPRYDSGKIPLTGSRNVFFTHISSIDLSLWTPASSICYMAVWVTDSQDQTTEISGHSFYFDAPPSGDILSPDNISTSSPFSVSVRGQDTEGLTRFSVFISNSAGEGQIICPGAPNPTKCSIDFPSDPATMSWQTPVIDPSTWPIGQYRIDFWAKDNRDQAKLVKSKTVSLTAPSPSCGNSSCDPGEDCSNCPDCFCQSDEECRGGLCVISTPTNIPPTDPVISAPPETTVNTPTPITVTLGDDPDGTLVKVQCTSPNSNYDGSVYDSGDMTGGSIIYPVFIWSNAGTQTIYCNTFDMDGAPSSPINATPNKSILVNDVVTNAECGNRIREIGEDCDYNDLGLNDCTDHDFSGGTLRCTDTCTFDTSQCFRAGNGSCTNNRRGETTRCILNGENLENSGTAPWIGCLNISSFNIRSNQIIVDGVWECNCALDSKDAAYDMPDGTHLEWQNIVETVLGPTTITEHWPQEGQYQNTIDAGFNGCNFGDNPAVFISGCEIISGSIDVTSHDQVNFRCKIVAEPNQSGDDGQKCIKKYSGATGQDQACCENCFDIQ